jgi:hypothetical protein
MPMNNGGLPNTPVELQLPSGDMNNGAGIRRPVPQMANRLPASVQTGGVPQSASQPSYIAPRQPVYMRNAPIPNNPQGSGNGAAAASGGSGLIGPIGYDAQ